MNPHWNEDLIFVITELFEEMLILTGVVLDPISQDLHPGQFGRPRRRDHRCVPQPLRCQKLLLLKVLSTREWRRFQENIHPRRLQRQHQSCYEFSPSRNSLFPLLKLFPICREELVGTLPVGFYMIDIFQCLISVIEKLTSAEDGKVYIFSNIKIKDNGQHDCETVDGGSWVKQGLVDKNEDLGLRVQSTTFYTKSKKRTNWSMVYSIYGQKSALYVICNTSAKRKVDSSNDMLPRQRSRLEQPFHQEKENIHVVSLVPTVPGTFMPISCPSNFGGGSQDAGPEMYLPSTPLLSNYLIGRTGLNDTIPSWYHHDIVKETAGVINPTPETFPSEFDTHVVEHREGILETSSSGVSTDQHMLVYTDMMQKLQISPLFDTGKMKADSLNDMLTKQRPSVEQPFHQEKENIHADTIQPRYQHDIVKETAGVINPTPETFPSGLHTHVVEHREHVQEGPAFNLSSHYSVSTFDVSSEFEEIDNFPVSTKTFLSDVTTDWKYNEEMIQEILGSPLLVTLELEQIRLMEGCPTESLLGSPLLGFEATSC